MTEVKWTTNSPDGTKPKIKRCKAILDNIIRTAYVAGSGGDCEIPKGTRVTDAVTGLGYTIGNTVTAGQAMGASGNSSTSNPHLHVIVLNASGVRINPATVFPRISDEPPIWTMDQPPICLNDPAIFSESVVPLRVAFTSKAMDADFFAVFVPDGAPNSGISGNSWTFAYSSWDGMDQAVIKKDQYSSTGQLASSTVVSKIDKDSNHRLAECDSITDKPVVCTVGWPLGSPSARKTYFQVPADIMAMGVGKKQIGVQSYNLRGEQTAQKSLPIEIEGGYSTNFSITGVTTVQDDDKFCVGTISASGRVSVIPTYTDGHISGGVGEIRSNADVNAPCLQYIYNNDRPYVPLTRQGNTLVSAPGSQRGQYDDWTVSFAIDEERLTTASLKYEGFPGKNYGAATGQPTLASDCH